MRATDQELIAIGKIDCYSQSPRWWSMPDHAEPHEVVLGSISRQRELEDSMSRSLYCAFHGKEWVRPCRQSRQSRRLVLTSLNNFYWLSLVVWYQARYQSSIMLIAMGMDSRMLGLHMKGMLPGK